jgi:tagatose 1,6-diphosphate aldolase GatY/KbaY
MMLAQTREILRRAADDGYAVGAFNVYNLEGVRAVVSAAEDSRSPVMLQLHPGALNLGGGPLVALCMQAAREATVPVSVHLDHSASKDDIKRALAAGLASIMVDGSHLPYEQNIEFTREMAALVHERDGMVEGELGRLSGTEDDLTVPENLAKLTDPAQAADFVSHTGLDALAVCIGNVHGRYRSEPRLDFERLAAIRETVSVPLVLHGASGLPVEMVRRSIELGVCKLNVNTEVREAYLGTLRQQLQEPKPPDLVKLMQSAIDAMKEVVLAKIELFGSSGKAVLRSE